MFISIHVSNNILLIQLIRKYMNKSLLFFLLLSSMMISSFGLQWYETGHTPKLDSTNFDALISEPNTYKFVKYYTHSCRYCRMLKQVQEQLQAQKKWQFTFYDIDCTTNYQFCTEKANPSAFPYVGVYNLKGQLQAQIAGFYPLDVMRDSFQNIQQRQIQALKLRKSGNQVKNTQTTTKVQQKLESKIEPKATQTKTPQTKSKQTNTHQTTKIYTNQKQTGKQPKAADKHSTKTKIPDESDEWSSISEGIKILMLLGGFWMFNKLIKPYLNQKQENKSRTVEIPLYGKGESAKNPSSSDQESKLLRDTL